MARLAGINIPDNKHAEISLTYIFGIGRRTAKDLCEATNVSPNTKIQDLSEAEQRSPTFLSSTLLGMS